VSQEDYTITSLSALLIKSYIAKNQETTDRMAVAQVDAKIREEVKKASPSALCLAAMILYLFEKFDTAKEYSERAYTLNPSDSFVLLAKGWCSMIFNDLTQNSG
jgi:hypothetical protein